MPDVIDKNEKIFSPENDEKFFYQWVKYEKVYIKQYENLIDELTTKLNDERDSITSNQASRTEKNEKIKELEEDLESLYHDIQLAEANFIDNGVLEAEAYDDRERCLIESDAKAILLLDKIDENNCFARYIESLDSEIDCNTRTNLDVFLNNVKNNCYYVTACEFGRNPDKQMYTNDLATINDELNQALADYTSAYYAFVGKNTVLASRTMQLQDSQNLLDNLNNDASEIIKELDKYDSEIVSLDNKIEESEKNISNYGSQIEKYSKLLDEDKKKNNANENEWIESDGTISEMPKEGQYTLWVQVRNGDSVQTYSHTYEVTSVSNGSTLIANKVDIKEDPLVLTETNDALDGPIKNPETGISINYKLLLVAFMIGMILLYKAKNIKVISRI